MLLHNLEKKPAETTQEIRPGVYTLQESEMKFLRSGYKLSHLRNDNEFLVTEGVPIKGSYFSSNRRLVRILSLKQVLRDSKTLNPWAKKVIRLVYNSFGIRPIHFPWLKRLFNPKYLIKA